MSDWKKIKIIPLTKELSLVDKDDLQISAVISTAAVVEFSSVCSVTIVSASEGDVLTYSAGEWVPHAPTVTTVTTTASDVLPPYPAGTSTYGLALSACGGYMWKKYADQDHFISFDARFSLTPATYEKGQTVATVTFVISSCNSTDYPLTGYSSILLNAGAVSAADIGGAFPALTFTPPTGIVEPTVISITIDASAEEVDKTASLAWYYKKYWGISPSATITASDIVAFPSQALATARAGTYTFNTCAIGNYLYIAWPTSFGSRTAFTVGGLATTFNEVTVSVTNAYSANTNYYLYKSQEIQFGTAISVVVT